MRPVGERPLFFIPATADIFDRLVDGRLRHVEAGVFRRAQRDNLEDRHGNVGVARKRFVAPAALLVLRADDELDGAFELGADLRRARLAIQLRKGDGGDAVAVHVIVALRVAISAVRLELIEEKLHSQRHVFAVFALLGKVPGREKSHEHITGHRDSMLHVARTRVRRPAAAAVLAGGEIFQRAVDRRFRLGIDDDSVLRRLVPG